MKSKGNDIVGVGVWSKRDTVSLNYGRFCGCSVLKAKLINQSKIIDENRWTILLGLFDIKIYYVI